MASPTCHFPQQIEHFSQTGENRELFSVFGRISVITWFSLQEGDSSLVSGIQAISDGSMRINGGFFHFQE